MGLGWVRNSAEKTICTTFDRLSLIRDRSSHWIYTVNPVEHSIPTLHLNTLWASLKQRLKHFDYGLPILQIKVLIHLNLKS